ncbi:MAG: two-component system sensor histidine kinase PhoQ [Oleispira sp.]|jgi:two-component system sensor histidine kinase PhoQ
MLNSLKVRLLIMTSAILIILTFSGGFLLLQSFSVVQMKALKERLKVHSYSILAQVEFYNQQLLLDSKLSDQHFNQPNSGLYAIILNENHQRVWASISAINLPNFSQTEIKVGQWQYSLANNGNEQLFIARYGVDLGSGKNSTFNIVLLEDMHGINQDLTDYRNTLIILLCSTAIFLFLMQLIILRWGLKPLHQLSDDLKEIQSGEKDELAGSYPKELRPLTSNLNHLLKVEQNQRNRYRNSLADLSHSLKTPISVIQGILYKDTVNKEDLHYIQSQVSKMTNTIRYQLQCAVHGFQGLNINKIAISPMINAVVDAMYKVYADKGLSIKLTLDQECYFQGDENDLMEILGNLIDNACKYCKNNVAIKIEHSDHALIFYFSDDGAGIPALQREAILQRGVRLDTVEAGQGMGLALVKEILDAYQAEIDVSDSMLGGACFKIVFNTHVASHD